MLLVGLTGGIGSGKSTVARLLAARGAHIVDADAVAREVVERGTPALAQLVERFGPEILAADGSLDRPALGRLAFADEQSRKDLEGITHPAINHEFLRRVGEAPQDAIVVCDVPLIFESQQARNRMYREVIVVEAPKEVRLARLEERGVPRADAEQRMSMQATDEERRSIATHVLDNGGDHAALERQVDELWPKLKAAAERAAREREEKKRHRGSVRSLCAKVRARLRLRPRG
ncbi:MAG: dephospho-CoA kinase [Actinobacteria bacterium]|nr:dephospho-CoA kinase [Actinomycetota bacterium]